jgi:hypothetical protein
MSGQVRDSTLFLCFSTTMGQPCSLPSALGLKSSPMDCTNNERPEARRFRRGFRTVRPFLKGLLPTPAHLAQTGSASQLSLSCFVPARTMDISADKAYWLFGDYQERATKLHIGVKVGGNEAACDRRIVAVDRELSLITMELFDPGSTEVRRRVIPLRNATFSVDYRGAEPCDNWVDNNSRWVLIAKYTDGTTVFFAEPV